MGNTALLIDNQADGSFFVASSQERTMPVSNLQTPHVTERWRSLANDAFFILDKGSSQPADTFAVFGITAGKNSSVALSLSNTNGGNDIFDSTSSDLGYYDYEYGAYVLTLPSPVSWRYAKFEIIDPDATYVEAGMVVDGLRTEFEFGFNSASTIQYVDLSKISTTASGLTLVWEDNFFRRLDLHFDILEWSERYGVIERMDRFKGMRRNVLAILDVDSDNLPRDTIFGLIKDLTPVTFTGISQIYGKQIRIDERL